jgi:hypothetical protein
MQEPHSSLKAVCSVNLCTAPTPTKGAAVHSPNSQTAVLYAWPVRAAVLEMKCYVFSLLPSSCILESCST